MLLLVIIQMICIYNFVSQEIHISIEMHLVATGLKNDRHVFGSFCGNLWNWCPDRFSCETSNNKNREKCTVFVRVKTTVVAL